MCTTQLNRLTRIIINQPREGAQTQPKMIKGQINLMALTNAFTETRKNSAGADVECITIPLAVNHLEKDQYGVKLRIIGWDRPNLKGNATHIVNQDVPKEVGEALKAAGEYPPTLGNFWDNGGAAAPAQGKTDPATMPLPEAGKPAPF